MEAIDSTASAVHHAGVNLKDFTRCQSEGVVLYTCRRLERIPGLRHGFSTRIDLRSAAPLNLSSTTWDPDSPVGENRQRFLAAVGVSPDSLALVSQVHSDIIHIICRDAKSWNPLTQGDALVTSAAGVTLGVRAADCLPILMVEPGAGVIAAVHAGWRGMLSRIVRKTVEVMARDLGADPGRLSVAVGPGIGPCCFEVGPEVVRAYERDYPAASVLHAHPVEPSKGLLDLRLALGIQLAEAGVLPENVLDLEACTRCHADEFFSYRVEGPRSGRLLAVVSILGSRSG